MLGRRAVAGIVTAILVLGLVICAILLQYELDAASRREQTLAARAAEAVESMATSVNAGLSGAQVLADPNSPLQESAFRRFAAGVVVATPVERIAYVVPVPHAERAEFESDIGGPIVEVTANDELLVAGRHDEYMAVRWVEPDNESTANLVGMDVNSDPQRIAAARASAAAGEPRFSPPVAIQPLEEQGFFVANPLYGLDPTPGSEPVAYLVTAVSAQFIAEGLAGQLPRNTRFEVLDGGSLLAASTPPPDGGHSAYVTAGGRRWTVTASIGSAHLIPALVALASTIAVAAAVGVFLRRLGRRTRELRESSESVRLLGMLSEQLAGTSTRSELAETACAHAGRGLRADLVELVTTDADTESAELADPELVAAVIAAGTEIYIADTTRRGDPLAQSLAARGFRTVAAAPLDSPLASRPAVIAWGWRAQTQLTESVRNSVAATAALCRQGLARADVQEARRASAAALSNLGRDLSVASTTEQITAAVLRHASEATAAEVAVFGLFDPTGDELVVRRAGGEDAPTDPIHVAVDPDGAFMRAMREGSPVVVGSQAWVGTDSELNMLFGTETQQVVARPLRDIRSEVLGVIAFGFAERHQRVLRTEPGRITAVSDLVAQTLDRAILYERDHELVVHLQRRLLAEPPEIAGMDVAARYIPASTTVGIGGDWYDVLELAGGSTAFVVGDVVGHGVEAVADMTEIRTAVSAVLLQQSDLAEAARRSTRIVTHSHSPYLRMATAALVVVDPDRTAVHYLHAGHPPTLLRAPGGGVARLDASTMPPIGVDGDDPSARSASAALVDGSVIVLYTDGLVERRGESIDVGIDRLAEALASADSDDVEAIADHLLAQCIGGHATEDDVALVVVSV